MLPYPGLDPFDEALAPYFFGRNRDARIIVANLESSRLTILYGPSAAGKSSVLLAGVIPSLRSETRPADIEPLDEPEPPPFAVALLRTWVASPLPRLMEAIRLAVVEALGGEEVEPWQPGRSAVETLRAWTERVTYLYVILDQFEEYFLYHPPGDEHGFDADLVAVLTAADLRVHILLSLREDCLSLLDRFKGKVPSLWGNSLRVGHLDVASAREAIQRPAEAYRDLHGPDSGPCEVEPDLVDELLASPELRAHRTMATDGGPAVIPADGAPRIETSYLQLVLRRLWQDAAAREDGELRRDRLRALGGPQSIVQHHLEDAMGRLSGDELDIAIDVLRFMVTPSKTKIAYTADDLAALVPHDASSIVAVLEKLASGNRILRRVLPASDPGRRGDATELAARYEIFHDILAEPILRWRAERAAERELRVEREAATERVRVADEAARRARRRAIASLGIAVLALGLLGAAAFAWFSAEKARDTADSQRLASAAATSLSVDPDRSVSLAMQGLQRSTTVEAERALRTALPASRLRGSLPVGRFGLAADFGGRRRLATGDSAGFLRVWDTAARRELMRVHEQSWVNAVSLADDGDLLLDAACCQPAGVSLWRVGDCLGGRRCQPIWRRDDPNSVVGELSADGTSVAVATGQTVRIFDVRACGSGRSCHPARPQVLRLGGWAVDATFAETPDTVAAVDFNGEITLWQRRKGRYQLGQRLRGPWREPKGIAVNARSGLLAATGDMRAQVWDLRRCRASCPVVGTVELPDWVNQLEFNAAGTRLAVAGEDGAVRIWKPRRITEPSVVLRGHPSTVFSATFDSRGKTVATAGADGTVRLWDASAGQVVAESPSWINSAVFAPDGKSIVTASADGTARIFDRSGSGRAVATLLVTAGASPTADERRAAEVAGTFVLAGGAARPAMVNAAAPSPDGRWIFTGDAEGKVQRWDVRKCVQMVVCDWYSSLVISSERSGAHPSTLSISQDSRIVAAAYSYDIGVKLFGVGGKRIATLSADAIHGQALGVHIVGRGDRLVTASAEGYVILWDIARCNPSRCKPRVVRTMRHPGPVYALESSPDGKRLVTGASDGIARIWTLTGSTSRPLELHGHASSVRAVAFSRTGTRVVTAGVDQTTRIWDARSGQELGVMQMHTGQVSSASFDPSGPSQILTAGTDGSVSLYGCDVCVPLRELRQMAARRQLDVHRRARLLRTP